MSANLTPVERLREGQGLPMLPTDCVRQPTWSPYQSARASERVGRRAGNERACQRVSETESSSAGTFQTSPRCGTLVRSVDGSADSP